MTFHFSVKTVCAALIAGAGSFSVAYYAQPLPITMAGWMTIAVAVIPPVVAAFFSDPSPAGKKLTFGK